MFVSTSSGFNDLYPALFQDVIVSQPCVLGKQYIVTTVQKCYPLRTEELRMRQDKKKKQGPIGAILYSCMTCLQKFCHSPANHDGIVVASKLIVKA